MNKFITQKLKPQDNLYTIRQYSSINDPSINERFNNKYSNLHILAAFSNAHIKNEIYYLTASTIQSEFPIKFREGTAAAEALRLLNMDEIYFFNIIIYYIKTKISQSLSGPTTVLNFNTVLQRSTSCINKDLLI